jgi:hypothetical protein
MPVGPQATAEVEAVLVVVVLAAGEAAALVAVATSVASAELLTLEAVWVGFTHRALRSPVNAQSLA